MILFLDDIREPNECYSLKHREKFGLPKFTENQKSILIKNLRKNSFWVTSYIDACNWIDKNGIPEMIFFDNDLGPGLEGYDFLKYACFKDIFFEAYFHTANPIARLNMQIYYDNWKKSLTNNNCHV